MELAYAMELVIQPRPVVRASILVSSNTLSAGETVRIKFSVVLICMTGVAGVKNHFLAYTDK